MKNTKKRLEIFNELTYELFHNVLKVKVSDIHLTEYCLFLTFTYKKRIYSIRIYDSEYNIRCNVNWKHIYSITKKF